MNFSSMVPLWIIFSILGALQTVCGGASFQNHAGLYLEKSRKNKQSETAAEGERILSFISSFPCSFWKKKIFSLKKTAIVTCIKIKKNKKTLDRAHGFYHPIATNERRTADGSGNSEK